MTQYVLSVHHTGRAPDLTVDEMRQSFADTAVLNDKMRDAGAFVFAAGLQPPEAARVVRRSGSDFVVTDGPFAETKEHLGGFWIIEAADLDEALDWSRQATVACRAPVEIRAVDNNPTIGDA